MDVKLPAIPVEWVSSVVNTLNNFVLEHRTFIKDTYIDFGDPFTVTSYDDCYVVDWYGLQLVSVLHKAVIPDATEEDALNFTSLLLGNLFDASACMQDTLAAITQEKEQSEQA